MDDDPHALHPPLGPRAWAAFLGPVVAVLAGLGVIAFGLPPDLSRDLLLFAGAYITPIGMEAGVVTGVGLGLSPLLLVGVVLYFDAWISLFWVVNLDHLGRWERTRDIQLRAERRAQAQFERHPWVERFAWLGLYAFIVLPIPGTGSVVGIAMGKLLGFERVPLWAASVAGTTTRVFVLAYLTAGTIGLFT